MKWIWVGVLALLCWFGSPEIEAASKSTDSQRQKAAAEARRAKLGKKLKVLKREIKKTEKAKDKAADTLAESKAAIAKTNRDLRTLSSRQQKTQKQLRKLSQEETQLDKTIASQKARLGQILRDLHAGGEDQHLKLLMSGDNPNRTSRELQYMAYLTQAQAELIESLRGNMQAIEANRRETESAKTRLAAIEKKKRAKKQELEREEARRAALLSKLAKKLAAKKREAKRLERNQKRMTNLVNRLSRLIARQRRDQQARKKTGSKKQLVNNQEPIAANDGKFARLRGKLRLPVKGVITEHFGSRPEAGPARKGVFIKTPKGAKIKAVATGKVVFADWLRGFGNLIIIDHGSQYMTIYGNNQTLYKKVGNSVKAGDVIAAAGDSGGRKDSGLYFEMRRRGKAFDPLKWVTIR